MTPALAALPKRLLVDTNVLLDVLLAEISPQESRSTLPETDDVALMGAFLQASECVATTPHVLAEIDGHLKKRFRRDLLLRARQRAWFSLQRWTREEFSAPLRVLDVRLLEAHGPSDAALVAVALAEALTLLTADVPLQQHAAASGVRVLPTWQVLQHPSRG